MHSIKENNIKSEGPSRLLYTIRDNDDWTRHKQNLRLMEGMIDLTQDDHLQVKVNKLKPDQIMEERITEIEKENRLLFSKISDLQNR